jgi:hypothetical protein
MGIHTHKDTHKLFDHYTVVAPFFLRNARKEIVLISKCSFLSDVHIFLFFHQHSSRAHPSASSIARQREEISDVLMITMMINVLYTFVPLEKFNNEMHPSMPTLGEIETKNEQEKERKKKRN